MLSLEAAIQTHARPIRPIAEAQRVHGTIQEREDVRGRPDRVRRCTVSNDFSDLVAGVGHFVLTVVVNSSATAEELLKEYKACESPDYISYVRPAIVPLWPMT